MAHCPYDKLGDLESALQEIRKLEKVVEKKPGVFYLKSKAFLHFHIKTDKSTAKNPNPTTRRWADARETLDQWGSEINLAMPMSPQDLAIFIKEIKRRYNNIILV
ncbi:MAG: hypothetical protein KC646_12430 [Candidatus Cloacimonetes bacterium]|nr:hypothetical protein [Candidatus Cloacimonadota bacterium]